MRRSVFFAALTLCAMGSRTAWAQAEPPSGSSLPTGASGALLVAPKEEPKPAAKPVVVAPSLVSDEGVQFPQEALEAGIDHDVQVRVSLDVDVEGHVTAVRVLTPQGHGFDEEAAAAAKKIVFKPATRDGKPVAAANVGYMYTFHAPASKLKGRVDGPSGPIAGATVDVRAEDGTVRSATTGADGAWGLEGFRPGTYHVTIRALGFKPREADEAVKVGQVAESTDHLEPEGTVPAKPPAEEEAQDVYVRGKAPVRDVTVRTVDQREMSRIPGTNGDAIRSLLNLPGVARPPGIAGLLIVRGSAPQDTQVFVDGTTIPLVYHFGGLSSVVPTEMLDKIDFYPGNFSARYGRGMGGIVDVALTEPKKDKLHGLAQIDLIDGRVMAQGPIFDTGWTFAVAGRRSWVDVWLKPVLEAAGAGVTAAPVYYDYQAILQKTWDKGRQDFRAAFFGSDDRLAILIKGVNASDPTLAGGLSTHTGFWRGQLRYRNRLDQSTELRVTAAAGQDYFDVSLGDLFFNITDWPISTRTEIAEKIAKDATMNVGADIVFSPYDVAVQAPPPPPPGQPPAGPFLARPPVFTHVKGSTFRPGFYDELELTPWRGARLVPGMRLDYSNEIQQWDFAPRMLVRQDLTSGFPRTTAKAAAGLYFQPPQFQETDPVFGQAGLKSNRATEYDVGVEQEFTRNVELSLDGFYKQLDRLVVQGNGNGGTGHAYGLEMLLRWKPDARFFGWLAYTLSRTEQQDAPGQPTHLGPFDQTHILTVLGSYRLGRGWEIGARFRLVSGDPYTARTYGFYDENNGSYLAQSAYPYFTQRYPLFHQLDIRVDKTWRFPSWQISAYLDVQNVYNQGNVEGISTNYNDTKQSYATGLPILPSFGLRVEF